MPVRIDALFYELELRADKYIRSMDDAKQASARFTSFIKANPIATAAALGAALLGAGAKAAQMAIQFDSAMRKMTLSMRDGEQHLGRLKEGVLDLARRLPIAVEQLAAGVRTITQISGREGRDPGFVLERLALGAEAAAASGEDLNDTLQRLDDVMDAFGLSGNESADAVMRMAFGIAQGRAPFGEFMQVLSQVAPAARGAGISLQSIASAIGAMFEAGISPAEQVRGLKAELTGTRDASGEATSRLDRLGIELKVVGDQLVVSGRAAGEYSDAMRDAATNTTAMAESLQRARAGPGAAWEQFLQRLKVRTLELGDALVGLAESWATLAAARRGLIPNAPAPTAQDFTGRAPANQRLVNYMGGFGVMARGGAGLDRGTGGNRPLTPEEIQRIQEAIRRLMQEIKKEGEKAKQQIEERIQRERALLAMRAEAEREFNEEFARQSNEDARRALEGSRGRERAFEQKRRAEEQAAQAAQKAKQDEAERTDRLAAQARNIEASARGALQLAEAFGAVDQQVASVLEGIVQTAANIPVLLSLLRSGKGNVLSIAGAALPVVGGIAQVLSSILGDSPEEARRRQILQENTEAIRALTQSVGDFGLGVTGSQFASVGSAAAATLGRAAGQNPFYFSSGGYFADLDQALRDAALTLSDMREVADALGISFAGARPSIVELQQLMDAMAQTELTRFAQTFTGQLEALRAEFELFDIEDPVEQLRRLRETAAGFSPAAAGLLGMDLSTPAGRAAAQAAIEGLFRQLQAGTLTPAQLGGLTPQQLLDLLLQMEGLLDRIAADAGAGAGGQTVGFGVNRSITEVTGSRIASILVTHDIRLEQIATNTALTAGYLAALIGAGAMPGLQPPPADRGGGPGMGVRIERLEITVAGASSAAQGEAAGAAAAGAFARQLNAQLGLAALARQRALGDPLLS